MARTAALVLLALAVVAASAALATATEFDSFANKYQRVYATPAERSFREQIFFSNLKQVANMNAELAAKGKDQVFNVTQFTDLTAAEFKARYTGYVAKPRVGGDDYVPTTVGSPASIDWRTKGVITPVKNQGQCGSCWAFSATETVESFWKLAGNPLTKLSVQQTVSCDNVDQGCNGGNTNTAYQYMMQAGGIEKDSAYPYASGGGNSGTCNFKQADIYAHITGFTYVTQSGDEKKLQSAAGSVGPISICVDASTWQFYSGGILSGNCGQQLDHCVQLTGYDTTAATPYWVVRNSWTPQWGEAGYIWIEQGMNLCGIANDATYVTI